MLITELKNTYLLLFFMVFYLNSCGQAKQEINNYIIEAAQQTEAYIPYLKGKNVAVVANQTSVIYSNANKSQYKHLVDSLLQLGISIKKVFAPEHGFRGIADAGETVHDVIDSKTGLEIVSLYGKNKKPTSSQLEDVDVVVFDIQDVGVRFYTYISTLHYVMEACAENNVKVIVLDRPNPNAHYIDGPVLEPEHSSFVGKHPVPVVYGMTIGEYAKMINGENWLANRINCELIIIPLKNYTHKSDYSLPINPSPNLPNDIAINLYPSLGFFEGTPINAGRGTENQFQVFGASWFPKTDFSYTPKPNEGAKHPKEQNKKCNGYDLRKVKKRNSINLDWLLYAYNNTPESIKFFQQTFTIHAGTEKLQQQIEKGHTEEEIKKTWQKDLEKFKKTRSKYLIYKD